MVPLFALSSVIRQRGVSRNGCFKKTKQPNFPKNKHFLPPYTYVCVSGGEKCFFFWKFGVLCFLETPILRFALLPYCRRRQDCTQDLSYNPSEQKFLECYEIVEASHLSDKHVRWELYIVLYAWENFV